MQIENNPARASRYLFAAHENERQRLGQELHDGLLQELYSLDFALVAFSEYLQEERAQTDWQELRRTLQRVSRRMRAICQDLRPPALGPFGLSAALRSYIERFREMYPKIEVSEELMDDGERFPEEVRLMIYRLCEHTLGNVAQHASARHVRVSLHLGEAEAVFLVEDDGQGFELPADWLEVARQRRYGLFGCRERATSFGGVVEIRSAPGAGVAVQLTLPASAWASEIV